MNNEQHEVARFMLCAEQEVPHVPKIPEHKVSCLRAELIIEEWQELCDALGVKHIDEQVFDWEPLPCKPPNLVEVADAIADLLVVVLGTAVACGIDAKPIFDEVMRSNMTKFIDGHRRED